MMQTADLHLKLPRSPLAAVLLAGLLLAAVLAVLALSIGPSQVQAQSVEQRTILGTIHSVVSLEAGLTIVTVQEEGGELVQLEVRDEFTIVEVPGQASSLGRDLQVGHTVAGLARQRVGVINVNTATSSELESLPQVGPARAQSIVNFRVERGPFHSISGLLDVPGITSGILDSIALQVVVNNWIQASHLVTKATEAVVHSHVTGVVVGLSPSSISVLDADGNRITLGLTLGGAAGISPGQAVTVAIRADARLGTYTAVDIDRVGDALERLTDALALAQEAGDSQNMVNLRLRLVDGVGRVNAALEQALARAPGVRAAVQASIGELQALLREFGLYGPVVTTTGVVDLADPAGGWLGITTEDGVAVDLAVTDETVIRDAGEAVALDGDLIGRRVMATYDPNPDSLRAHRINLVRDTGLPAHIVQQLAMEASRGEAEGYVVGMDLSASPGYITLQLDDESLLPLRAVPGAGYSVGLASFLNDQVEVRYDAHTYELLDIEPLTPRLGEVPVAGVVVDLDLKEAKEVKVALVNGTVLTLTLVDNTEMERDSVPINRSQINVGDLVRPTSRYVASDITFLSLRRLALVSPIANITGPVLGVDAAGGRITMLPESGQLVTILVNGDTDILRDGEPDTLESVAPGETLGVGSLYDPLTSVATRIIIDPAKVARTSGAIVNLDNDDFIVTVAPDDGSAQLALLVPYKPRIITLNGDATASFYDLRNGYRVDTLLYRHRDNVVVVMVASSR